MKKFEYRVLYTAGQRMKEEDLNALGSEGWELINIIFDAAYFKREKKAATRAKTKRSPAKKKTGKAK